MRGSEEVPVDVRVIAATNKDLAEEVRQGASGMTCQLNVIEIRIPPLRERREDIPPCFAEHFLDRIAHELGKEVGGISPGALKLLME